MNGVLLLITFTLLLIVGCKKRRVFYKKYESVHDDTIVKWVDLNDTGRSYEQKVCKDVSKVCPNVLNSYPTIEGICCFSGNLQF